MDHRFEDRLRKGGVGAKQLKELTDIDGARDGVEGRADLSVRRRATWGISGGSLRPAGRNKTRNRYTQYKLNAAEQSLT